MSAADGDSSGVGIDWAAIYAEVYPGLVRYLHRKVWDADRAAELAQDVFVRALGARPENPRAWLFTVAANIANDEARLVLRRKRHLTLLKRETVAEPPRVDPIAVMQREERAEAIRRALDALNERDREVLLLRDAGLSYPEIAAQTGLAVGAVGTTLSRARKRLVEAHASPGDKDVGRDSVPGNREESHATRG